MTKNNIDHIIENKFEGLNYEFKDEYWSQMEKKINANISSGASTGGSIFGSTLSTVLIVSVTTILTLLAVYFLIFRGENSPPNNNICTDTVIEKQIETESINQKPIDDNSIQNTKLDNTNLDAEEEVSEKVVIKKTRKHSSKKSKQTTEINDNKESTSKSVDDEAVKKVATSIETYDTTKEMLEDPKEELDEVQYPETIIDNQSTESNNETDHISLEENIAPTKQTVSYENDSIYIPEAKLVGDKQDKQNQSGQIEIEAGPKPVKTVKPKNKPVKHVFKKRKGLLYRLGIRK